MQNELLYLQKKCGASELLYLQMAHLQIALITKKKLAKTKTKRILAMKMWQQNLGGQANQ